MFEDLDIWYTTFYKPMAIQLQLFNRPPKKVDQTPFMKTITAESEYIPNTAENLLSDRFITQNGMLLLRQKMGAAYRQKDWKTYLQLVRFEIDIKKGRITFDHALKSSMLIKN